MRNYQDYLRNKAREYGDRFDTSDLDPRFVRFFESGERIRVESYGETYTGTVGVTTGWKPSFLLKFRSNDHGSWYLLDAASTITGVKHGRVYA